MLGISQKLSQQQKLSPMQIQYQKLLQLNTLALEQRIKTELELNPILEEQQIEEYELTQEQLETDSKGDDDGYETDEIKIDEGEEFQLEDYMNDSDTEYDNYNHGNEEEKMHPIAPSRESLSEYLLVQLRHLNLDEELYRLGEEIIGNLNDDGYLKRELSDITDELEMFEHLSISSVEAEQLLKKIQRFDPVGVATRSLHECLVVQIQNSSFDPYYSYLAEQVLIHHFEDFVNRRFDLIRQKMNLTEETLKATIAIIQKLNPKPGEGNIVSEQLNQITPDFIIDKVDDNFVITLNDRHLPSVTISRTYLEMLDGNKKKKKKNVREKDAYKFLKEKFESAKWFIACIQQRKETMLRTMRAILEKQYKFFEFGPKHLRPMIYKDIADELQLDISTISRVVNGKYVQSQMGIHELKYFFSEGLSTDSGEEVSNKHIKERIKEIIDEESKQNPLSDDKIAEILNDEGIHVARRTVAKYREQMRISIARLRKEV